MQINKEQKVAEIKAVWSKTIGKYLYVDADDSVKPAKVSSMDYFGSRVQWNETFLHVLTAVNNRVIKLMFGSLLSIGIMKIKYKCYQNI